MIIGIPKEIKVEENRVSITPAGVHDFIQAGHEVIVEKGAGNGSGFTDKEYTNEGASLVNKPSEVFSNAEMIIKVKEPQPEEIDLFQKNQILYTYLHLAASKKLTEDLLKKEIIGIAYETIEVNNKLVCLEPMSEIAGKVASLMGAVYLGKHFNGKGLLAGGVAGIHSANILILGGGTAGINAAKIAAGLGARVVVMDIDLERLRYLEDVLPSNCETLMSNKSNIENELPTVDLIIGTVLIPGAKAPKLITKPMLKKMQPGTVIVDVSIDQGGCTDTSKTTSHANPTYLEDSIVHYCVSNMPGAYPRSSTFALTNATMPFGIEIANLGWKQAAQQSDAIKKGINVIGSNITYESVATAHGLKYTDIDTLL